MSPESTDVEPGHVFGDSMHVTAWGLKPVGYPSTHDCDDCFPPSMDLGTSKFNGVQNPTTKLGLQFAILSFAKFEARESLNSSAKEAGPLLHGY